MAAEAKMIDDRRHIVSLSGGKDSVAMLLLMAEKGMRVDEAVFFDGGWEFPQVVATVEKLKDYLPHINIVTVKPEKTFTEMMIDHPTYARSGENKGQFLRNGYGWSTPFRRWCNSQKVKYISEGRKDDIHYIGYAANEKERAARYVKGFARNGKNRVFRFPLITFNMTEPEALQYCIDRGFDFGGIYNHFPRSSCFCCPLQRIGALKNLYKHYPDLWQQMLDWDDAMQPPRDFRMGHKKLREFDERFRKEIEAEKK